MNFVLRTLVTALVLWLTSLILPNRVNIMDNGEAWGTLLAVLLIALIFNAIHSVIKPIVKTLTGCLYLLTLGLFSLVVNALMLWLTTWITGHDGWLSGTDWGLEVNGGFWWFVLVALLIAVLQALLAPLRFGARVVTSS